MTMKNVRRLILLSLLLGIVASCSKSETAPAANTPKIVTNTEIVYDKGRVTMFGSGFTPKTDVHSHLQRPDGTEFPVLTILTDAEGKFTHEIDSLLLGLGTHQLWVEDSSGVSSNVARFEVTKDLPATR
jgi:hypothetical protein